MSEASIDPADAVGTIDTDPSNAGLVMDAFHPAVRTWFDRRFELGPTPPQRAGWPAVRRGEDVLIAAPTGSGKTLSAFLVCIDRFYHQAHAEAHPRPDDFALTAGPEDDAEPVPKGVEVVYVSPLKALAADIQANLSGPLAEIADVARELGHPVPEIRVGMRSGDTPASARAAMVRKPPQILVTTPESLYLLVTAEKSREILRGVKTVIVDEIHAMARDKRGSHLAITLERLEALTDVKPARLGLSATQRPIETVSRLLTGGAPLDVEKGESPPCTIVDEGHKRALDLALQLPAGEMEAVVSGEQMADVLRQIADEVEQHRTTLVFVNTRRMAERLAHELMDRLGEDGVSAHHGSLSKERRLRVEARLRAGELKALVATASLELGIDVGPVELVCQVGSPRSLATFLQRVGRSGHFLGGLPKGRLFPTTRDELVECAALLRGVKQGRLDALRPPKAPLDILAQQIVAACGADDWFEDDLFELMRRAAPFAELERRAFDDVVEMLSEGIQTGRGKRAAYLHRDRVNGKLVGRRGARLAALTSGGAIPDVADYRVIADPDDTYVGSVDEDFAIESMAGDVFLLGSTSWRVRRVENGVLRVVDAQGSPPNIPFWFGEAPARTTELSDEVSELRKAMLPFVEHGDRTAAELWLAEEAGLSGEPAAQIYAYLHAAYVSLGTLPTRDQLVFERFFDEAGGMQLVIHSPLGGAINRAFCLSLRKKFCRTFNYELQAAANDDAMVLSLGPHHSFPLEGVPRYLQSESVEETLGQAVLDSPMFQARWRWNLNRSLAILRFRGGKRNPPPIQRMEADDFMAALFPNNAACQENVTFPIEIPDQPIVKQTLYDCLHEAMDVDGLRETIAGIEQGRLRAHCVDTTEPSLLSHEILNGRPYTFLDDAPLEERRTRAVQLRRGLPVEARELAKLDVEAIDRVREEVAPDPRDADELHDVLLSLWVWPVDPDLAPMLDLLIETGRAYTWQRAGRSFACAAERRSGIEALLPDIVFSPDRSLPEHLRVGEPPTAQFAAREAVAGHLDVSGPITAAGLAEYLAIDPVAVEVALASLEGEGAVLRGAFETTAAATGEQFCARRLLSRIHRYTQARLRSEIEPVTAQDCMRFLLRWQRAAPARRHSGRPGVAGVIEQLQGIEIAAGAWEESILPARISDYRPGWLDELCMAGEVAWGRLSLRAEASRGDGGGDDAEAEGQTRRGAVPSRATPVAFALRGDLPWLLQAVRGTGRPAEPGSGAAAEILACLRETGALFHAELEGRLDRLPVAIEEGLWGLVGRGIVTADGFQAVRSLLGARERWARTRARDRARRGLRRGLRNGPSGAAEGRWSLLPDVTPIDDPDALAEAVAEQLLVRWGVVFRDLVAREPMTVPWRDLLWAFRRMEARGIVRGGRFVSGFVGEQYALPEAVDQLRRVRRMERRSEHGEPGEIVTLSAVDPLNLTGVLLPGPKVPRVRTQEVRFRDGLPMVKPDKIVVSTSRNDGLLGRGL